MVMFHLPGNRVEVSQWTVPGTYYWQKPPGATVVLISCRSGGGAGGTGASGILAISGSLGGGGGGASGRAETRLVPAILLPDTLRIVVGAGGVPSGTQGGNGGTGEQTEVYMGPESGDLISSCSGGPGGSGGTTTGGAGGTGTTELTGQLLPASGGTLRTASGKAQGGSGSIGSGNAPVLSSSFNGSGALGGGGGAGVVSGGALSASGGTSFSNPSGYESGIFYSIPQPSWPGDASSCPPPAGTLVGVGGRGGSADRDGSAWDGAAGLLGAGGGGGGAADSAYSFGVGGAGGDGLVLIASWR